MNQRRRTMTLTGMLLGFLTGAVMIVSGALSLEFGAEDISGPIYLAVGGVELALGFLSMGFFVHFNRTQPVPVPVPSQYPV